MIEVVTMTAVVAAAAEVTKIVVEAAVAEVS
jgi:hypothetical protein